MVTLTIDGRTVQAQEGATILEAAAQADIHIPHLCYLKGINEIAACRVCCVEVEGERAMVTACNNPVKEGMVVHTNSPRVRTTRRINVELILSQHDCKCATCVRSGNCQLQTIANDLGIVKVHYETQLPRGLRGAWTTTFPLYHDYNKCIKCMRCIQVCDKVQTLSIWDVSGTGGRTMIDVSGNRVMKDSDCALCGQCITHCPTGGLRERDDTMEVFSALADPDKITVVQVAPAVRTAWGEAFGLPREQATMERMAAALRRLGFDYVWEIGWTQDTLAYFAAPFGGRSALFRQLCGSFGPFGAVQGINALSHDENHPASIFTRLYGNVEEKLAQMRLLLLLQAARPGKSLLFAGVEFGQPDAFTDGREPNWAMLADAGHRALADYSKALNAFCLAHPALYAPQSFAWTAQDASTGVLGFTLQAGCETLLCALNTGTQAVQGFGLKPGWGSCALPLFAAGWVDNAPRPIANGWLALDLAPLSGGIWQIE